MNELNYNFCISGCTKRFRRLEKGYEKVKKLCIFVPPKQATKPIATGLLPNSSMVTNINNNYILPYRQVRLPYHTNPSRQANPSKIIDHFAIDSVDLCPRRKTTSIKPVFHLPIFPREQVKSECDWMVISSCLSPANQIDFLRSREQIRSGENRLNNRIICL
jgi:hypothetical protein